MRDDLQQLSKRIRREVADLERTRDLALRRWQKGLTDEDYLGSVAFDLHSFYRGVERVFEAVAKSIDRAVPAGEKWHKMLLDQMTEEISGIRPAVISMETREALDDFRRFRHIARNIYTFNLDPMRIRSLVEKLPEGVDRACKDFLLFAEFLRQSNAHK